MQAPNEQSIPSSGNVSGNADEEAGYKCTVQKESNIWYLLSMASSPPELDMMAAIL